MNKFKEGQNVFFINNRKYCNYCSDLTEGKHKAKVFIISTKNHVNYGIRIENYNGHDLSRAIRHGHVNGRWVSEQELEDYGEPNDWV